MKLIISLVNAYLILRNICCNSLLFIMFQNDYSWKDKCLADFILGIVLVLPKVFIVSYGIAKFVREITRGSVMGCYFND